MPEPPSLIFVSALDANAASHRFRVAKLAPKLREAGAEVSLIHFPRPLAAARLVRLLGLRGRREPRPLVVFQKTVSPALARLARGLGARVVMDLDDGGDQRIDGSPASETERRALASFLRGLDGAVVSVEALARWVEPWTARCFVIPTCLDVETYAGLAAAGGSPCVIGWVGGPMSRVVLPPLAPTLAEVCATGAAELFVMGGNDPELPMELHARFEPWSLAREPAVFGELDIGIMPLPRNQRAEMKAGFKLLQYMAAGLPVVATPVGVNREIVREGENGFLAEGSEQWRSALARLVADPGLRHRLGENGRAWVRERFGLGIAAGHWLGVYRALCDPTASPPSA